MTDVAANFAAAANSVLAEVNRLHDVILPPPTVIDVPDEGMNIVAPVADYENVAFRSLSPHRTTVNPAAVQRGAVSFYAPTGVPEQRVTLRNVRFHDLANAGIYNQSSYQLEGVTALGAGWAVLGEDTRLSGRHGMNFYSQNNTDAMDEVTGCIFGASYSGMSWKFFTEGGSDLKHLRVKDTLFLSGETMAGGRKPVEDVRFENSMWLDCRHSSGWVSETNKDVSITNSLLRFPVFTRQWETIEFTGNTVYMTAADNNIVRLEGVINPAWNWDYNIYYVDEYYTHSNPPVRVPLWRCGVFNQKTFTDWQALTGLDAHSEIRNILDMPLQVRLMPVNVGRHAANVGVYNPCRDPSMNLNLGTLEHGIYELRSIYDDRDIQRLEWVGTPLEIELNRSFVPRIGQGAYTPPWMENPMPVTVAFELWKVF